MTRMETARQLCIALNVEETSDNLTLIFNALCKPGRIGAPQSVYKQCPDCKQTLLRADFKGQSKCPACWRIYDRRRHMLLRLVGREVYRTMTKDERRIKLGVTDGPV